MDTYNIISQNQEENNSSARRDFLRKGCQICGMIAIGGGMTSLLSGCSTLPIFSAKVENKKIQVPLSAFKDGAKNVIVRNTGVLDYDLLLVTNQNSAPICLIMNCTHRNYDLVPSDTKLSCNNHGSSYNLKGEVITGPATTPLKQYPVTLLDNIYSITIS